ncbi:MAG: TetR-like C-terminal domain-containing protein [Candidatus Velthaea sp.]|jgi:AcrR family transcriptional regulator
MARRPGLDRRAIIEEAAALADELGLENVTLANLAERLKIRPPSLYNHIAGTDELHAGLALLGVRTLQTEIARAAIGRNGVEGVIAVADAYRRFAKSRPGLYRATLSAPEQTDVERIAVASEILDVMRAVMLPLQLRGDEVIHAMRALRSLMHGFVSLEAVHGFGLPQDVDESFRFMLLAFVRAFDPDRIAAVPELSLLDAAPPKKPQPKAHPSPMPL